MLQRKHAAVDLANTCPRVRTEKHLTCSKCGLWIGSVVLTTVACLRLPSPRSFPSTPSSKAWSCDSISIMLCEQRARRAVKSTVVVQTGAGNLVEALNVCLKGQCGVASAAQHVRRLTERLSLRCSWRPRVRSLR